MVQVQQAPCIMIESLEYFPVYPSQTQSITVLSHDHHFSFSPFPLLAHSFLGCTTFSSPALSLTQGIFEERKEVYESYDKFNSEMLSQTTKNHQACYKVYTS